MKLARPRVCAAAGLAVAALLAPRSLPAMATGADFLDADIPARPAAMAGAFAANDDDATAFLWDPAALGGLSQPLLSATHFLSIVDTEFDQACYVEPLNVWGANTGLGLDMQYDTTSNFDQIDAEGNNLGAVQNYDLLVEGAGGLTLGKGLRLGAGLKVFDSVLSQFHSRGYAVDLGGQQDLGPDVCLGAALLNLGSESAFDQVADALPTKLSMAARWLAVDTALSTFQGSVEVDRFLDQDNPTTIGFGGEYWYAHTLVFRMGWLFGAYSGPLSIGVGFRWKSLSLDYAYSSLGDLGMMNRFSLSLALGSLFQNLGWTVAPIEGRQDQASPAIPHVQAP